MRVRGLYAHIAQQLRGLYFKDGGPIIAAQVDNEYMASSAPWEMTTGISREWVPSGHDGAGYLERLRDIAIEEGIDPPMFTCTGWQSPVPDDMLPLWGGYAYRPWLFYDGVGAEGMTEHPATDEYRYRRLHGSSTSDGFDPPYDPDSRPYACCEMGGGMFNSYDYRFVLPKRSVDAMANIKLGSGCDFLGYYMFHGGTNPKGAAGFLNEGQTPKRSYDFQAPLGEFGQVRESYGGCAPCTSSSKPSGRTRRNAGLVAGRAGPHRSVRLRDPPVCRAQRWRTGFRVHRQLPGPCARAEPSR